MAILHIDFFSRALGRSAQMDAILPDARGTAEKPWKTLYLLHGMTDDYTAWQRWTSIERYAEEYGIAVIMPDTRLGWYTDTAAGERYFSFVSDELIRISRRMFPSLSHQKEDTFVAGLSMGGYGAMKCALKKPETFCKAASLSGALDIYGVTQLDPPLGEKGYWEDIFGPIEAIKGSENDVFAAAEALTADRPELFMWCGTEDFLYTMNTAMRDHLMKLGYKLTYSESSGDHNWKYWDREIQNVLAWMLQREEESACL